MIDCIFLNKRKKNILFYVLLYDFLFYKKKKIFIKKYIFTKQSILKIFKLMLKLYGFLVYKKSNFRSF